MAEEEELAQSTVGEFVTVSHLLATSEALQIALIIMAAGIIGTVIAYRKFSSWVGAQRFYYQRPHISRFLRRAVLPVFVIILITVINVHVQTGILEREEDGSGTGAGGGGSAEPGSGPASEETLTASETFAKILNTLNILVVGYTIAHMIPIALTKHERTGQERADFDAWFEMRGFADDRDGFFHTLYKWIPPKEAPEDMAREEFERLLKTEKGVAQLEKFHTSKGNPLGAYEKNVKNPFERWKKSERSKYAKYYKDCTSGKNKTGLKLKPGVRPAEIFPIDTWREEKRLAGHEPIIPGAHPPGYADKKREGLPKSTKQLLPAGIFAATVLGVLGWWGVDLLVLATATGGFSIGLGLALQETMKNYFAYLRIRKDKVFAEGDRVQLDSGYNGYVHKITPFVTYIRNALHESIAIIPTSSLVSAQIINYTKDNELVPAVVKVGVSYLNNPKQVAAILVKVGERAMRELTDARGRHLVRQRECPYLGENRPSCGCDRELHVELMQPAVRFVNFNDSSLDFELWVYVRNYGAQFKATTDMRIMIYEEFMRYDIRIPWPIRTIYQGDEKREGKEIGMLDEERNKVIDECGMGDLARSDGD